MVKKILFSLAALAAFIIVIEGLARLFELRETNHAGLTIVKPGWQTEFFGSIFDWHEPDPELLWRFKADLDNPLIKTNSQHLLGEPVESPKPPGVWRVLILGDSSPVGLGLASRMFAFDAILKYLLENHFGNTRRIEIVNAAVSGYTSEQIKTFLALRGWTYDPDLVVLYCGNNDASVSGKYSDRELLANQKLGETRSFLRHLAFYRLLKALLIARPKRGAEDTLQVRVPAAEFAENLGNIAAQCASHNCPIVILKPAVPYLWPAGLQFRIFRHITGRDGELIFPTEMAEFLGKKIKYCLDRERFAALYGQGDIFARGVYSSAYSDSMTLPAAIDYYSEQVQKSKNDPVLYNNLGVSFWQAEQYREADFALRSARAVYKKNLAGDSSLLALASGSPFLYNLGITQLSLAGADTVYLADTNSLPRQYLDSALQADYFSLRIKKPYWAVIDGFSNRDGIAVIDLPDIFRRNGGERLFIDHCHPTQKGHYIIAEEILRVVKEKGW